MFDFFFGWRKASKCKKLIRRVQLRLKLLKNKRTCIVKQLHQDVAELLRLGHEKSAFDRVEQILKDESMVEVYDLIDKFCEYIIINLRYLRKHKDCPNDINEAVSTLIFASARFGDLPELLSVRKHFRECYGQRFTSAALELHPGNCVNHQIRESLSIQNVPDEVKFKVLDEIGGSFVDPGLLLLEYKPELQQEPVTKPVGNKISSNDGLEMPVSNIEERQGKIVYIDLSSQNSYKFKAVPIIEEKLVKSLQNNDMVKFTVSVPEEVIYLDDIEEFASTLNKDGNCQDQRLFVFKSSVTATKSKIDYANENDVKEKIVPRNDKVSAKPRKARKSGGKRLRRSFSTENRDVNDVEYYYYGNRLSNYKTKSLNRRKHQKRISVEDKNGSQENESSKYRKRELISSETATSKVFTMHSLHEERDEKPHLRAMSMPLERPKDNVLRSQSFPLQQINGSSCYRHVHPKLPDYDELAAKFMSLKNANC